jgi:2',3'-cyclic-nucleotide 2'-phosphodiesterase / 3'-nucleotidase / 5'-nucleotidase
MTRIACACSRLVVTPSLHIAGYLPDMVKTKPNDCSVVVTANEGEGVERDGVFFNPEGTISVLKFDDLDLAPTSNIELDFTAWNAKAEMHYQRGVHYGLRPEAAEAAGYDPAEATFSKDLEPEYIAFSANGDTAIIMLQDNNAIVSVDLRNPLDPKLGPLLPLGFKDWTGLYVSPLSPPNPWWSVASGRLARRWSGRDAWV